MVRVGGARRCLAAKSVQWAAPCALSTRIAACHKRYAVCYLLPGAVHTADVTPALSRALCACLLHHAPEPRRAGAAAACVLVTERPTLLPALVAALRHWANEQADATMLTVRPGRGWVVVAVVERQRGGVEVASAGLLP